MFFRDKSVKVTLPETKMVHGVEIKKVPVGRYINALKKQEELPAVILDTCFPGKSIDEIAAMFMSADRDTIIYVAGRLLASAPELAVSILCEIIGLDYEHTINTYTPTELLDIATAFWEVNDLSDFFKRAWALIKEKLLTLTTGFKNGLQLPKA